MRRFCVVSPFLKKLMYKKCVEVWSMKKFFWATWRRRIYDKSPFIPSLKRWPRRSTTPSSTLWCSSYQVGWSLAMGRYFVFAWNEKIQIKWLFDGHIWFWVVKMYTNKINVFLNATKKKFCWLKPCFSHTRTFFVIKVTRDFTIMTLAQNKSKI